MVLELLAAAPDLRLLLTSRQQLDIQPEWVVAVAGLGYPETIELPQEGAGSIQTYGAMELFYQRARRLRTDFDWREEWEAMARICRHVEGLPLAIELAAPWVQSLSCDEIADQVEQEMDFLAAALRDVEPRHRSIRRVFEQTWQMLSEEEQHVLSRLSIFRGGFTRLAAAQVAGATLSLLSALVGKTLLQRNEAGRYDSQELLRQFCTTKLASDPAALVRTRDRHCAYFTSLLAHRYEALLWRRPAETYLALSAEIDNINAAWVWAVERGNLSAMDRAFEIYWQLLDWRGAGEMIITVFGDAAEKVATMHGADAAQESQRLCLLGEMLIPVGQRRAHNLGLRTEGHALAIEGLALIREADPVDKRKEFWARLRLGLISNEVDIEEAERVFEECIDICQDIGDYHSLAVAHGALAWCYFMQHDLDKTRWHVGESLDLIAQFGNNRWSHVSHYLQAVLKIQEGDYDTAQQVVERMNQFSREINNRHMVCISLGLQAQLARINGDYTAARSLCVDALQMTERAGVPDLEPYLQVILSALSRLEDSYEEAAGFLAQSAAYVDRHRLSAVSVWAEQGRLAYAQQDYATAAELLRKAAAGGIPWKPYDDFGSIDADLGDVLCAMGDAGAARCYRRSLRKSQEERALPSALQALGGLARLHAQSGDPRQSLEQADLVEGHPTTWHEHRVQARQLVQELEAALPFETVMTVRRQADKRDPWDVINEISASLLDKHSLTLTGSTKR